MDTSDDRKLLAEYVRTNSEAAFAALVSQYGNLVYSAALRFTGDYHDAEEITQSVFIILARKAGSLAPRVILSGWLYQTARLTAGNFMKQKSRRQRRELAVEIEENSTEGETWKRIAPGLDEAMGRLDAADRNALVLRFFENKSAREMAAALNLTEAAAHKKLSRALEKLRKFFASRGLASSGALIAGAISTHSVQAAPAALLGSVAANAAAQGAAASSSTLMLAKGVMNLMAWTKAKATIAVAAGVLLAVAGATEAIKIGRRHWSNPWQDGPLTVQVLEAQRPQVKVLRAKKQSWGGSTVSTVGWNGNVKTFGLGFYADELVERAYSQNSPTRIFFVDPLPQGYFDFIACLNKDDQQALQKEVCGKLGITAKMETVETNVLLLVPDHGNAPGLRLSAAVPPPGNSSGYGREGYWAAANQPVSALAAYLESALGVPVIDRTGLTNSYDMDLRWAVKPVYPRPDFKNGYRRQWLEANPQVLENAVREQLGLQLVPATDLVDVLAVRKIKQ